jgi:hypothetical protein
VVEICAAGGRAKPSIIGAPQRHISLFGGVEAAGEQLSKSNTSGVEEFIGSVVGI